MEVMPVQGLPLAALLRLGGCIGDRQGPESLWHLAGEESGPAVSLDLNLNLVIPGLGSITTDLGGPRC